MQTPASFVSGLFDLHTEEEEEDENGRFRPNVSCRRAMLVTSLGFDRVSG